MGKLITLILIVAGVGALFYAIEAFSPVKFSSLLQSDPSFGQGACIRIVTVADSSMEPTFKNGSVALFNKCVEGKTENIKVGTVVLVEPFLQPEKIRVVRKKELIAGKVNYRVSTLKAPDTLEDAPASNIKGIYEKK